MSRPMPAYNMRSGARAAPNGTVPGTANPRAAGTVLGTAEPQADLDPNSEGSIDRSSEAPGVNTGTMADFPKSLKDPSVLIL